MIPERVALQIGQMRQAALDAQSFVEGLTRDEFLVDRRTQQAVVMSLMIIGEISTKIIDRHPDFVSRNTTVPWHAMRGMRNRIAHGYFSVDMTIVWDTVVTTLTPLLSALDGLA